jgi:hypothetical protein
MLQAPGQSASSFIYSTVGCSNSTVNNDANSCVSCPPDFRSSEGGTGSAQPTLGLRIPCSGQIAVAPWGPVLPGIWRVEKPGSISANAPCGPVRHLVTISFSDWRNLGSCELCSVSPTTIAWSVSLEVLTSDFGQNPVPSATYSGSATATATFNYPNPLP